MVKVGDYDYPDDVMDTMKINKVVRDEIKKYCKEKKINKGKLIEEFYKAIILRHKDGSLDATNGYITINILRSPIIKSFKSSK